jgi:Protein of unknown function (DUF4232)
MSERPRRSGDGYGYATCAGGARRRIARRPVRSVAVAALLGSVLILSIMLPGASAAPAKAHAAAVPRCSTSGLVMWVNPDGGGTTGSYYYHVEIWNQSQHACRLGGYPGASAVDLNGRRVGPPAVREVTGRPAVVTLAPEDHTSVIVRVTDVGALPRAACRPVPAAGFRIYPPGNTASKVAPFPFHTCSGPQGSIRVRAVKTEEGY